MEGQELDPEPLNANDRPIQLRPKVCKFVCFSLGHLLLSNYSVLDLIFELYSSTTDVEKINTQEIVHSQPLPSEFLRDRSPYSQVTPEQPANVQQQQQNGTIPTAPSKPQQQKSSKQRPERDSRTYHVDSLPESLWDEALTVAAQTYAYLSSLIISTLLLVCIMS